MSLVPFFLIMCTHLSSLISSSSVSHLLYTDETQFHIFYSKSFTAISNLQSTISLISSSMSSTHLTLNLSKTAFPLIDIPQETYTIINVTFSLLPMCLSYELLPLKISLSSFPLPFPLPSISAICYYRIRDVCRIRHPIDFTAPSPSLPVLLIHDSINATRSLIHSSHPNQKCTTNSKCTRWSRNPHS